MKLRCVGEKLANRTLMFHRGIIRGAVGYSLYICYREVLLSAWIGNSSELDVVIQIFQDPLRDFYS